MINWLFRKKKLESSIYHSSAYRKEKGNLWLSDPSDVAKFCNDLVQQNKTNGSNDIDYDVIVESPYLYNVVWSRRYDFMYYIIDKTSRKTLGEIWYKNGKEMEDAPWVN